LEWSEILFPLLEEKVALFPKSKDECRVRYLMNDEQNPEVCPSLPQDKLATDDAQGRDDGYQKKMRKSLQLSHFSVANYDYLFFNFSVR
jgi:hypothetical protein